LLCIYGGNGSGKSFILNAIGNLYVETYKDNDVILVNSLKFIQDIFACKKNSELIQNIKNNILKNKCILFDDIQDFNTTPIISEIFLQILYIAKLENKIVVLTSNLAPNEFKHAGKNFSDRISSGMSVIIHSPSLSDKKKFIISELNNSGSELELTNDALEYLAGRTVDSNLNKIIVMIDKVSVFAETNDTKV
jgi:chromosomal replication initiation ATPase DnaA